MIMPLCERALAPQASRTRHASVLRPTPITRAGKWLPGGPRLFHGFLKYLPLLWLLGALTPLAALTVVRMAAERWPRGVLINLVIGAWALIGLCQAMMAVLNGIAIGNVAKGVTASFGFGVTGWLLGGLAMAAGAGHRLCGPRTVRAVTWLGGYILVLSALALIARMCGMHELSLAPTPVSLFLPHSPSVEFYTEVLVFQTEETLGEATTRLVLFFPWTTGLGLGGLAIAFISTLDRSVAWRLIGLAGGLVGIVFSWSRIAIGTFVAVSALLIFLRMPKFWRLAVIGGGLAALFGLALDGINPFLAVSKAQDTAKQARAGSSMARDLIYQKSWEGFLQSPVIGHGWVGESVHRIESLPIGSHSTIYGLLYTGGLPTLLTFALAMLLTLAAILLRLSQSGGDGRMGSREQLVGLGLLLCLAAYCPYEALYNLTLPCVFLFTWIGACVGGRVEVPAPDAVTVLQPAAGPASAPRVNAILAPSGRPAVLSAFERHTD